MAARCVLESSHATGPLKGSISYDDALTQNVEISYDGENFVVGGVADWNRSGVADEVIAHIEGRGTDPLEGAIKGMLRIVDARSKAAWLRAAYLTAFAAVGYAYILRSSLNPVRLAIREPSEESLPVGAGVHLDRTFGFDEKVLAVVQEPAELRGALYWVFTWHSVLLPPVFENDDSFYEHLAAFVEDGFPDKIAARPIEWPSSPRHDLDQ